MLEGTWMPPPEGDGVSLVEYYIHWVGLASVGVYGPEQGRWLDWLREQHPRIISALDACLTDPDSVPLGLELGAVSWEFWSRYDYLRAGAEKLEALLRQDTSATPCWARAMVYLGIGKLQLLVGENEQAQISYQESSTIGKQIHDKEIIANSLIGMGVAIVNTGTFGDSMMFFEEALDLFEQLDDLRGIAKCYRAMGIVHSRMASYEAIASYEAAIDYLQKGVTIAQKEGYADAEADCLLDMGMVALHQANYFQAQEFFDKSLSIVQQLGDPIREAGICLNLAYLAEKQEDHQGVKRNADRAAKMSRALGMGRHEAFALINVAAGHLLDDELDAAYAVLLSSIKLLCSLAQPDFYALSQAIEDSGHVLYKKGNFISSITLHGAAAYLREQTKVAMGGDTVLDVKIRLDDMKAAVGAEKYSVCWERGRAMTLEQILSFLLSHA